MSSGASTWLHGQRKVELLAIADKVGLKDYDSLKKPELEAALDDHMRANQTALSKDSSLQAFFKRVGASPSKKDVANTESKTPRPRRSIKAKEDLEPTDASDLETSNKALVTRTPRTSISFASNVPLPPSPAVVANQIDRQTAKVRSSIQNLWTNSGIVESSDELRDRLSNTTTIESIGIFLELYGMQRDVLPLKYLAFLPASKILGTPEIPLKVPDLFVLLSSDFWLTFSLWLATSVLMPMTFSYFFNLPLKAKHGHVKHAKNEQASTPYDPLTFNISKALITWLVYAKGIRAGGWVNGESVAKLEAAFPGGHQGVLIGTSIGALTSIYEAVLKK
ncbi:hypothetical protein MMC13_003182 [Lambiella insularis]|nr:hypothetical protein [Lambiella insularis]